MNTSMKNSTKWALAIIITSFLNIGLVVWCAFGGIDKGKFLAFVLLVAACGIGLKAGQKEYEHEQSGGSKEI